MGTDSPQWTVWTRGGPPRAEGQGAVVVRRRGDRRADLVLPGDLVGLSHVTSEGCGHRHGDRYGGEWGNDVNGDLMRQDIKRRNFPTKRGGRSPRFPPFARPIGG
ncbi:hypothetical protein GCM10022220_70270 [Actinocatenispora rupis]|uniref:Uncharacterized protein n=1 Tax=Actinocatenispora rupis TaxID=519421 RepID=A0A8J3J6V9_9ACTN|nr:hypothetical protein Aru02nite_20580 [Actinocatenispora rupis]